MNRAIYSELLTRKAQLVITGTGAFAVNRTMGARCFRTGSWRRSGRRARVRT